MKRLQILAIMLTMFACGAFAQRFMDNLGRGLVVVPTGSTESSKTNFVSWRRLGTEYYDVTYNLYKDGTKIASNLTTTSYNDNNNGLPSSKYQVAAVVRGVEQAKCTAVTAWAQYVYKLSVRCATGYIDLPLAKVYDRNGNDVTSHYSPNDAEFADLDGDGELEMIIKRLNDYDASGSWDGVSKDIYATNSKEFVVLDAYDINWQTGAASLMWRIDCGPNMVSLNSTEIDIIAFDWDEDGKAEVVLRGADDMIVYGSDGKTKKYTIGTAGANYRSQMTSHSNSQYAWTKDGPEYLIYMNGQTGAKYQVTTYPLARLESGETNLKSAWGDDYGHRSTKHFLGAPYLDGRTPNLFLARGIYTREKMIAMNLNKSTHQWSTRWTWNCNSSSSDWYGNGYHNFIIADVDEDGRDEIVYGSMVIDDNGKGLSTTGLGHGDAQHVSDFDPWRKGLEFFGCNEDNPGMNYRNATTSELYVRSTASSDDGRAIMANFLNTYPGSLGRSVSSSMYNSVTDQAITSLSGDNLIAWGDLNFRIYWDGDLCSEILNSPGTAKEAKIEKPGTGRLFTSSGCNMNNDSKNNPCFQGDLIGDWREEIVVRCGTNVRIYTSGMGTNYSFPTLWHDHQYRQAMVWQMMAYNQPPHLSYFLGEMEGYTVAPPPLMTNERTVLENGATVTTAYDGQHLLFCPQANATLTFEGKVAPAVLTINTPTWVQGANDNNSIKTTTYTHKLTYTGSDFTFQGNMRLVKQGDGIVNLPKKTLNHTGNTDIWGGTVNFNGTMNNSNVWMNRFTTMNSETATFKKSFTMEYASTLNVGGATSGNIGTVTIGDLKLNYGARVVLDINGSGDGEHDVLNLTSLTIDDSKVGVDAWENYGPKYIAPVLQLRVGAELANGLYPIGTCETLNGDLEKIVMECTGINLSYLSLVHQDNMLYLKVQSPEVNESKIEIVDMAKYSGSSSATELYLPVIGVTTTETNGQTPKLSGTFTNLDGVTTSLGSADGEVIYSQDYESETAISGWTSPGANMSLGTGDDTYGKYFYVNTGNTNTRYAYQRLSGVNVSNHDQYSISFDLALKSGSKDGIEFCVMSKNGTNPTNNWDNYASINGNANMLFDLTAASGSTSFVVNDTSTTILASETWYHVTLNVNQAMRTVAWTISNGSSGTFNLPSGTSTEFDGFYLVAGRYNSMLKLDNIIIRSSAVDLSTYTFKEPGTLTITSYISDSSYEPSVATFEVPYAYTKLYESPDYNTIKAADAASVLGGSFSTEPFTSRWAYWNKTNATYGEHYVFVSSGKDSGYLDDDAILNFHRTSSDQFHLVEGFGIGHNYVKGNTTITASGLGDENTIVYYKSDQSRGGNSLYDAGYTYANADGSWTYELYQNTTFCKFIAYKPYRFLLGDLNHDGYVNITDVVLLVNYVLGSDDGIVIESEADINNDGAVNITDVVVLTNIILNNK